MLQLVTLVYLNRIAVGVKAKNVFLVENRDHTRARAIHGRLITVQTKPHAGIRHVHRVWMMPIVVGVRQTNTVYPAMPHHHSKVIAAVPTIFTLSVLVDTKIVLRWICLFHSMDVPIVMCAEFTVTTFAAMAILCYTIQPCSWILLLLAVWSLRLKLL